MNVVTLESSLCLSFIAYHSVVYRRQRLRPLAPTLLAEPEPLQSNLLFGPIDGPLASIMFKFMRGKGGQAGADRVKLQKELFAFNKTGTHGFPHYPSALAYDYELGLLAIGTRSGLLRVYGAPGVEFYAQLETETEIRQIVFIEKRAQLITLSADSSLHLWEINTK
ncbi:unnamed protein product, partial [Oppiella nova]